MRLGGSSKLSTGGELVKCSFCGKSQKRVKKVIAGPGVYICDECIGLCNEIMAEELADRRKGDPARAGAHPAEGGWSGASASVSLPTDPDGRGRLREARELVARLQVLLGEPEPEAGR